MNGIWVIVIIIFIVALILGCYIEVLFNKVIKNIKDIKEELDRIKNELKKGR